MIWRYTDEYFLGLVDMTTVPRTQKYVLHGSVVCTNSTHYPLDDAGRGSFLNVCNLGPALTSIRIICGGVGP